MCMVTAAPQLPQMPAETAAMKPPDGAAVRTAAQRRTMDRFGIGTPTILTSGRGVTATAPTDKKTILG